MCRAPFTSWCSAAAKLLAQVGSSARRGTSLISSTTLRSWPSSESRHLGLSRVWRASWAFAEREIMPRRYRTRYGWDSHTARRATAERFRAAHIRAAQELTAELGGADNDVKAFFFSLRGQELSEVLWQYEL